MFGLSQQVGGYPGRIGCVVGDNGRFRWPAQAINPKHKHFSMDPLLKNDLYSLGPTLPIRQDHTAFALENRPPMR